WWESLGVDEVLAILLGDNISGIVTGEWRGEGIKGPDLRVVAGALKEDTDEGGHTHPEGSESPAYE
ncbi:hypothetical protein LCGC14_1261520, partial [marine sediment metagenome]